MKKIAGTPETSASQGAFGSVVLTAVFAFGCGGGYGPSHSDMVKATQQEGVAAIAAKGGSASEKHYPQGDAWVVNLAKVTVDDEIVESVKVLGRVSELDLSGSTITDEQFAALAESEALGVLFKLDISNTGITDAGLRAAKGLAILYDLNVKGSKVTPEGLAEFGKNRPPHPFNAKLKVTQ